MIKKLFETLIICYEESSVRNSKRGLMTQELKLCNSIIIYPSSRSDSEDPRTVTKIEKKLALKIFHMEPRLKTIDGESSAPPLERALQVSLALTRRNIKHIWAARGGFGSTELIKYLEKILPPIIPSKTLIGFSDISFLGVYLSLKYPNLRYIHGRVFFQKENILKFPQEVKRLKEILEKKQTSKKTFQTKVFSSLHFNKLLGRCVPMNLSLAESLATLKNIELPQKNILFIEDCNERAYQIYRKIDSLINSQFLKNTHALVLGDFTHKVNSETIPMKKLVEIIAFKTGLPTISLPIFGHGKTCYPIEYGSTVEILRLKDKVELSISKPSHHNEALPERFGLTGLNPQIPNTLHVMAVGGTAMSSCVGLFKKKIKNISGSDHKIYPPMDKVVNDLNITLYTGYKKKNIEKKDYDAILVGNSISPLSSELKRNEELDYLLSKNAPFYSLPSFLKTFFLNKSFNIIVTGTHGKTTTTALTTQLFKSLKYNPSFLVAGLANNFGKSYELNNEKLFILEADEYDSAYFDKGPKFLHYNPSITIINNIEFDHADIYTSLQDIIEEFKMLIKITERNKGCIVANYDDINLRPLLKKVKTPVMFFSTRKHSNAKNILSLVKYKTLKSGTDVSLKLPSSEIINLNVPILGLHNIKNLMASLCALHCYKLMQSYGNDLKKDFSLHKSKTLLQNVKSSFKNFRGVKRRLELLCHEKNIHVFEDFAHHPSSIEATLKTLKDFRKSNNLKGRLIACFEPKNATMRKNTLEADLAKSLSLSDIALLGNIPRDKRIPQSEWLQGESVIKKIKSPSKFFTHNEKLLEYLKNNLMSQDIVVFMSSGSFDGIMTKLSNYLKS